MFPPDELKDRFRATVLGCAIGDALGFPLEGLPAETIARIPMLAEDFAPRPRGRFQKGQFTDDTQMTVALLESLVAEKRVDGRGIRYVRTHRQGSLGSLARTSRHGDAVALGDEALGDGAADAAISAGDEDDAISGHESSR